MSKTVSAVWEGGKNSGLYRFSQEISCDRSNKTADSDKKECLHSGLEIKVPEANYIAQTILRI